MRAMLAADVETIVPMEQQLFAGDPPWSAQQFAEELRGVPDTRWYVVATVDGEIVGYAGMSAPFLAGDPADVLTIAVASGWQQRGIGTRLLDELAGEAGRRDAGELLLEVRADNEAALEFYRRHGFERIAVRRNYYAGQRDGLVLRRRLPARPRGGFAA